MHLLIFSLAYKKKTGMFKATEKRRKKKDLFRLFPSHFRLHFLSPPGRSEIMPTEALHCGESNTKPNRAGKHLNMKAAKLVSPQRKGRRSPLS